ncbi:MAG: response regulator [Desulfonatronovibrio sp. MSAO_Bac4]|nr:MAG: response regulator [Desulfonatronovibrio sp. MSAO_Bac4]
MREKRFLVVDDSGMVRMHIRKLLESIFASVTVHQAEDGHAALELLDKEKVDIVISDWNMPNMSGEELLYEIRSSEKLKNTPFIMMSTNDSRDFLITAIQLGVTQYIVKPFSANELEEKIHSCIGMLNRRREKRYALPQHVARLTIDKQTFEGTLIDLSRTGAAFTLDQFSPSFVLYKVCTLDLIVPCNRSLDKSSMLISGLNGRIVRLEAKDTFHPTSTEFQGALYFNPVNMKREVESKLNKLIKLLAGRTPDYINNE